MFARKSGCCSASREREDTPTLRCTRASTPRAYRKLADLASTRELEQESAGQGRLLRSVWIREDAFVDHFVSSGSGVRQDRRPAEPICGGVIGSGRRSTRNH